AVVVLGHKFIPAPTPLSLKDAMSFLYLGKLIRIEGQVVDNGYNAWGTVLSIGSAKNQYRVFVPQAPGAAKADLSHILHGDKVAVTGIALQYCPQPPYNSGWQLLVADTGAIAVTDSPVSPAPPYILGAVAVILLVGVFLWSRERRMRSQRKKLRKTYQLGEEILSASSPSTILKRISESLPGILGVTRVQLYVYN